MSRQQPSPHSAAPDLITKTRKDLHLPRRIWHIFGGFCLIYLYTAVAPSRPVYIALLIFITAIAILIDTIRLRSKEFNARYLKLVRAIIRSNETIQPSAATFFLAGALLSAIFYSKPIFIVAILFLALGDPIAGIIGILYGKTKLLENATLEGSLACFVVCGILTYIGFCFYPEITRHPLLFAIGGGLGGMIAELLPTKLDDNLVIPLYSGFHLYALQHILG